MRRWLVIAVVVMVVLGFVGPVAWTLIGWPPPGLVLKYGPTPGCEPMGRVKNVEGIEFVEIGPGCFRMGSEHLAEGGDFLGRWCARLGLPWGDQPKASNEMPVRVQVRLSKGEPSATSSLALPPEDLVRGGPSLPALRRQGARDLPPKD